MKVLKFLAGVLSLICAFICFMHPFATQLVYGYIIACFIGVMGVISIIDYFVSKKNRPLKAAIVGPSGLVLGILGVLFFIFNTTVEGFTLAVQFIAAVIFMIFILVEGVSTLVNSFTLKKVLGTGGWIFFLIFGILMILAGIAGLSCLPIVVSMFGTFTAIGFIINSVYMITSCFSDDF